MVAEPEGILAQLFNANSGQDKVLVKWRNQPDHDCSWEWKSKMKRLFPHINLEDKDEFKGGVLILTKQTIHQYSTNIKGGTGFNSR